MNLPEQAPVPRPILAAVPRREGAVPRSVGRRFYDRNPQLRVVRDTQPWIGVHLIRITVIIAWVGMGGGLWFGPPVTKSSPGYKFATFLPYWTWTWGAVFILIGLAQLTFLIRRRPNPCPGLLFGTMVAGLWTGGFAVELFTGHVVGLTAPFTWAVLTAAQARENRWIPRWLAHRVLR